jgi:cobalt-zinc-cadmium efflux system membrane fusion protein
MRPLQFGDSVTEGQVLAVIWCKEVGEKKSDLVDALSKLYTDKFTLDRLNGLPKGVVADQTIREAKRNFDADLISVERAERTLRSWRIAEEELHEVREEARRIQEGQEAADRHVEKTWAEVEVRAPFAGVMMEKNTVVGNIVDTTLDMFKIADLSQLAVFAQAYEEDLSRLNALKPEERKWEIDIKAIPDDPRIPGRFDVIGKVVDPAQHTASIMGWVENADNRLYVGQFIKATIELPCDRHEVAVPASAVIEDPPYSYVLVASDAKASRVMLRRVAVTRHSGKMIVIQGDPNEQERKAGAEPLRTNERVVASGSLELRSALEELQAAAKVQAASSRKLLDLK